MWYILHEQNQEFSVNSIKKILRLRELPDRETLFEGYCLSHRIPEDFENQIKGEISVTLNVINEETIKVCFWNWEQILTFKNEIFEHEGSQYELYSKI